MGRLLLLHRLQPTVQVVGPPGIAHRARLSGIAIIIAAARTATT